MTKVFSSSGIAFQDMLLPAHRIGKGGCSILNVTLLYDLSLAVPFVKAVSTFPPHWGLGGGLEVRVLSYSIDPSSNPAEDYIFW